MARLTVVSTRREPTRGTGLAAPLLAALMMVGLPSGMASQVVETSSMRPPEGTRVLRQQVVVGAPLDSVWRAYTTKEGLRSFMAPVVSIDLRVGGMREASYDPDARIGDPGNIVNEILAYLPREMISFRVVQTPTGFPYPEAVKQLWTVVQLDPMEDERVRVTATMLGFGDGQPWDALYQAFRRDNMIEFRRLVERFETGPIDWRRLHEQVPDTQKGEPMSTDRSRTLDEPLHASISIELPPQAAFERFTVDIGEWWPLKSHSVGLEDGGTVVFEDRPGGRIYEVLKDGSEETWGKVVEWEPPSKVVYTWHPGRAPETAQRIVVRFEESAGGTELKVEQSGWERFGEGAAEMRQEYVEGWPRVLEAFRSR